ncbi:hypothetical protein AMS68_001749 [Peltaster fructicola]|uniref:tRNA-dihydrouridine(16/17) synthase [NAD(P)(+)] n=1 Tax=Peltaster fructicola TaxID=286661 RepID=A0A6H0XN99_9PEZI|nr:hypothetical protein AMS68_001749 [Peltaster fructicola]
MVDQSEFAWRLLTRSFLPQDLRRSILTYSPMLHAKLFTEANKYRNEHFKPLQSPYSVPFPADQEEQKTAIQNHEPFQDGHPQIDRPLFIQFCANEPNTLLAAAKVVAPYCDAVDLNLGCPQGIAKRGGYGAFLQEDWKTIHNMINTLHENLSIPITAKMRILETKERTLEYAKMILNAGASILTVHGRQREQKGHNTGVADWTVIRYLRESLPPETVMFANGNILQHEDLQKCLDATGVDGIMSAEGNLYDPSIFAPPPDAARYGREYWQGKDGKGGYRMDAVLRRYLDIVYKHVLRVEPPQRQPLWLPSDPPTFEETVDNEEDGQPATKKQKREESKGKGKPSRPSDISLSAIQAHCFNILRPLIAKHTNVRDALAKVRVGEMDGFERVLKLTEAAVKSGLLEYEQDPTSFEYPGPTDEELNDADSSVAAIKRCKRPFFICQPYVRPLPIEALAKGSLQLSKKEKKKQEAEEQAARLAKEAGVSANGDVETARIESSGATAKDSQTQTNDTRAEKVEIPKEGLVCG